MRKPFLSIIIPTLNEEFYLPRLLEDLRRQQWKSFEVIIIDGRSDDNTKKAADIFKNDLQLQFITVEKRNVAYQRNYGAKLSSGRYIVFFDADNRISPSFLKRLQNSLKKTKHLIIIPQYISQDKFFQDKTVFKALNFLLEASHLTTKPFSLGACLIFEQSYFHFLGGFNERLYLSEDHDIVQRAKKYGVTIKVLKNISVKVSLRRFKREGRLNLLKEYLIATIHTLKSGGVERKVTDYKMGGSSYDKQIQNYFREIKKK